MLHPAKERYAAGALILSMLGAIAIKKFEGSSDVAYIDPVGIPTICVGSTKNVFVGQRAAPGECEARLQEDTTYAGKAIARCTDVKLTQGQYDALVSFTFNVGGGAYCKSTLLKKLNAGDCHGAANEFQRWSRAGGRVLPGLVTRRAAEAKMFREGCDASS